MKDCGDRELGHIGTVGIVSALLAFLLVLALGGCATPGVEAKFIRCHPSNYEKCADHCAAEGGKQAFILENATDIQCVCDKPPEGV